MTQPWLARARKVGVCFCRQEDCQEQENCARERMVVGGGVGVMEGKCMLVKWSLS